MGRTEWKQAHPLKDGILTPKKPSKLSGDWGLGERNLGKSEVRV